MTAKEWICLVVTKKGRRMISSAPNVFNLVNYEKAGLCNCLPSSLNRDSNRLISLDFAN